MSLYKLMVVDDEVVIRDGMTSYDWAQWGFQAVASASSGRKALKLLEENPVDLIITDIKMPAMDGLELCKIVKEKYPDCLCVVLTGYKEFEYAKTALQIGVVDYLLKPVDLAKCAPLFERIRKELDTRKVHQEKLDHMIPVATEKLLNELLLGTAPDWDDLKERMELMEISLGEPWYACAALMINGADLSHDELASVLMPPLNQHDDDYGYLLKNDFGFVLLFNIKVPEGKSREEYFVTKMDLLYSAYKEAFPRQIIAFGISTPYRHLRALPTAYREARTALSKKIHAKDSQLYFYADMDNNALAMQTEYPYELETSLLDAILRGDKHICYINADHYLTALDSFLPPNATQDFKALVSQFLSLLQRKMAEQNISLTKLDLKAPYTEYVNQFTTIEGLRKSLLSIVVKACLLVENQKQDTGLGQNTSVEQVTRFINQHYNEKITLNAMADMVYLNASYFSVQFKKQVGRNFIDYLTEVRMERAMALLRQTDMKVYEIGEQVGYNNPRYFTDTFRKYTGLPPLEYRQS